MARMLGYKMVRILRIGIGHQEVFVALGRDKFTCWCVYMTANSYGGWIYPLRKLLMPLFRQFLRRNVLWSLSQQCCRDASW
eukprot:COSAG02_NODE_35740_length_464_cov_0.854795_1_plen_81_part_00